MAKSTAGRPSRYNPEYCDLVVQHMSKGNSWGAVAGMLDVCKDTLNEWANRHPAFSAAKKRGHAKLEKYLVDAGRMAMFGQRQKDKDGNIIDFKNFNSIVWLFMLKNCCGWRDKPEGDDEKNNSINISLNYTTNKNNA